MKRSPFSTRLFSFGSLPLLGVLVVGCALIRPRNVVPEGNVVVSVFGTGKVSVDANDAARLAIFQELSQKQGLQLAIQPRVQRHDLQDKTTVHLDHVTIEEAVATLASGFPYWLGYAFDPATSRYHLDIVAVGKGGVAHAAYLTRRREHQERKAAREKAREQGSPGAGEEESSPSPPSPVPSETPPG